jgi:hypothetical protein
MMLQITQRHSGKIAALLCTLLYAELAIGARAGYISTLERAPLRSEAAVYAPAPVTYARMTGTTVQAAAADMPRMITREKPRPAATLTGANKPLPGGRQAKKERRKKKAQPDIGGPGQPEMKSFASVGTSNMVDLFSGDFSYNIPLLDVGGYPIGIHYSGGITMDQEPSWVGLGWNITILTEKTKL